MAGVDLLNSPYANSGGSNWYDEVDDVEAQTNTGAGASSPGSNPFGGGDTTEAKPTSPSENPFGDINDVFDKEDDPEAYMGIYESIKTNIEMIEQNTKKVLQLCDEYNASTQTKQDKGIMDSLDNIMIDNNKITQRIKSSLESEKEKNDQYTKDHPGSSVAQWRINQLNTCTRRFKTAATTFQSELNSFKNTLKDKQRRHIGILNSDPESKLSEDQIDELVENPEAAANYIQQQFQLVDVSDAMLDRLAELEARHEGMVKIEKGVKELQEMWNELFVLITEQQELLDNVENNVLQTKDYVQSAVKHVEAAEKHQKCSRKLQLCLFAGCLIILLIIVLSVTIK